MEYPDQLILNYLAGECTEADVYRLQQWRQEKTENDLYFRKLQMLWQHGEIKTETFNPDVIHALETIQRKIDARKSRNFPHPERKHTLLYYVTRIAASVIIVFGVSFAYYLYQHAKPELTTIATIADGKREISLSDGTTVWLNENSRLRFPEKYSADRREVYLEGEAYFDVTKDPSRPFIIHTHQSVTQVLGTSFNVRALAGEEKTTVTVTSGRVSFYKASHPQLKILLTKGDRGVLDHGSNAAIKETNTDPNFLAWKSKKLIFNDTPLATVAETLSAHYHKKIVIAPSLSKCRFTSTFENQPLEEILEELVLLQDIKIEHSGDVIQLSGSGC